MAKLFTSVITLTLLGFSISSLLVICTLSEAKSISFFTSTLKTLINFDKEIASIKMIPEILEKLKQKEKK